MSAAVAIGSHRNRGPQNVMAEGRFAATVFACDYSAECLRYRVEYIASLSHAVSPLHSSTEVCSYVLHARGRKTILAPENKLKRLMTIVKACFDSLTVEWLLLLLLLLSCLFVL